MDEQRGLAAFCRSVYHHADKIRHKVAGPKSNAAPSDVECPAPLADVYVSASYSAC